MAKKRKSTKKYTYAIGRRREAVATIRLFKGKGEMKVNDKPIASYFDGQVDNHYYNKPFELTGTLGKFYATFLVKGGVLCGEVGPKIATVGLCNAADACINPESFAATTSANDRRSIASEREVFPVRFIHLL